MSYKYQSVTSLDLLHLQELAFYWILITFCLFYLRSQSILLKFILGSSSFYIISKGNILCSFTWYCHVSVNMTTMDLVGAELLLYYSNTLLHFWMAIGWFCCFLFEKPRKVSCRFFPFHISCRNYVLNQNTAVSIELRHPLDHFNSLLIRIWPLDLSP